MPRGVYDRGRHVPAAANLAEDEHEPDPAVDAAPRAYRLLAAHGFIEEVHGKGIFHWVEGEIITRPATIALLRSRGASMEPV